MTFSLIKKSLPNFSDDVIREWIIPFTENLGWPPVHSRWSGILEGKDISFWRKTK